MALSLHHKRAWLLALAGALLATVPLLGFTSWGNEGLAVQTAVATPRPIRAAVLASGRIAHEEEVSLTSEVVGKVETLHVHEGQSVRRGDLLLVIDGEAYAAEVAQHRAAARLEEIDIARHETLVAALERRFERDARLFERRLLEPHAFEAVQDERELARIDLASSIERLSRARARLHQAEKHLDRTRVRAPIDGVVTALEIEAGETAVPSSTNIPGNRLLTIANPATLVAEVHVDEAEIGTVQVGQRASVVAVAYPNAPLTGIVEFVANTAKPREGHQALSFLVRVHIGATPHVRLRPGMSCRSEIHTSDTGDVLATPMEAIIAEEGPGAKLREFVFLVRDGKVRKVAVETGRSDDAHQEIVSGLRDGDMVVTGPSRALRSLHDGERVRADGRPDDSPTRRPFSEGET